MQKDNILFIFTDQWRADCVGFHGNKIVKTLIWTTLHSIALILQIAIRFVHYVHQQEEVL